MRLSHARPVGSVGFDDPNLVSVAGLVPLVRLANSARTADPRSLIGAGSGRSRGVRVARVPLGIQDSSRRRRRRLRVTSRTPRTDLIP
jgi:hypothetical protein